MEPVLRKWKILGTWRPKRPRELETSEIKCRALATPKKRLGLSVCFCWNLLGPLGLNKRLLACTKDSAMCAIASERNPFVRTQLNQPPLSPDRLLPFGQKVGSGLPPSCHMCGPLDDTPWVLARSSADRWLNWPLQTYNQPVWWFFQARSSRDTPALPTQDS